MEKHANCGDKGYLIKNGFDLCNKWYLTNNYLRDDKLTMKGHLQIQMNRKIAIVISSIKNTSRK